MARSRLVCLLLVDGVSCALLVAEAPLRRVLASLLSADLVLTWADSVRFFTGVHQLSILLPDKFPLCVLFVTEDEVVGRDRRRVDLLHDLLALVVAPTAGGAVRGSLPSNPFLLFEVGARTRDLLNFLWTEFTALETFDTRCEAGMRLHELDTKLIQAEPLQRLGTLHVSIDLIESIGDIVTTGACYRKQRKEVKQVTHTY